MTFALATTVEDRAEADRLYAYHLAMAAMYFEASSAPIAPSFSTVPEHARPAAEAFNDALEAYFESLD